MKDFFKNSEYEHSDTAIENNLDNSANEHVLYKFAVFKYLLLNPIRIKLGLPITISSGYRTFKLNTILNGARNSQHMAEGESIAVDLKVLNLADLKRLFSIIISTQQFDQLILERKYSSTKKEFTYWIHVSYNFDELRREVLIYDNGNYYKYKNLEQIKDF